MAIFIALALVLFFIITFLGFFLITGKAYGDGTKLYVVLSKLLLSIFAYLLSSFVIFFAMIFIVIGPEPRARNKSVGAEISVQTVCLILVGVYGVIGWALCSFINGKIIKSISEFNLSNEKPQSILPLDYRR